MYTMDTKYKLFISSYNKIFYFRVNLLIFKFDRFKSTRDKKILKVWVYADIFLTDSNNV